MKKRILAIDDSQASLLLIKIIFKKYENVEVHLCENSANALQLTKELQPDLIFLDIMMPGVDGIEILKELKTKDSFREIPVIILSANTEPQLNEMVRSYRPHAIHAKPIDPFGICKIAEELLGRD